LICAFHITQTDTLTLTAKGVCHMFLYDHKKPDRANLVIYVISIPKIMILGIDKQIIKPCLVCGLPCFFSISIPIPIHDLHTRFIFVLSIRLSVMTNTRPAASETMPVMVITLSMSPKSLKRPDPYSFR